MSRRIDVGYVPLLDAAPLIIAAEMGFAAEEGLELALHREMSWAALRDRLIWGRYARRAHAGAGGRSPRPPGLGVGDAALDALMVLSVNGDMIGAAPALAARDRRGGRRLPRRRRHRPRARRRGAGRPLRFGVPFPLSMHAALVDYWLGRAAALADGVSLVTVPPPRMAAAMAAGEIDAFCVGEPWGSVAVEIGAAELILPGAAIWRFAPEKVLAMPREAVEAEPERAAALMRALWRAARWIADPANAMTAAELARAGPRISTSRPRSSSGPARAARRRRAAATSARVPRAIEFFAGAASFPWRSQALWIAEATGADAPAPTGRRCAPPRGRASAPTSTAPCSGRSAPTCRAPPRSSRARCRRRPRSPRRSAGCCSDPTASSTAGFSILPEAIDATLICRANPAQTAQIRQCEYCRPDEFSCAARTAPA